jgi:hypothetical protein
VSFSLIRFCCCLILIFGLGLSSNAQSKEKQEKKKEEKTETFGEFVENVGKSIWSRFNERFNLEKAGKDLVDKKDQILSPFQKKEKLPKSENSDEENPKKKRTIPESEPRDP